MLDPARDPASARPEMLAKVLLHRQLRPCHGDKHVVGNHIAVEEVPTYEASNSVCAVIVDYPS